MKHNDLPDEILRNRFIFYYTFRLLWKSYKKSVPALYSKLFPRNSDENKGSKTFYDRILRMDSVRIESYAEDIVEKTGLSKKYILGEEKFETNAFDYDWQQFITLRKNPDKDPGKLNELEAKIKSDVLALKKNKALNHSQRILLHYIESGSKYEDDTVINRINSLSGIVKEFRVHDFTKIPIETLVKHQQEMQQYLDRLSAHIEIKKWENVLKNQTPCIQAQTK